MAGDRDAKVLGVARWMGLKFCRPRYPLSELPTSRFPRVPQAIEPYIELSLSSVTVPREILLASHF